MNQLKSRETMERALRCALHRFFLPSFTGGIFLLVATPAAHAQLAVDRLELELRTDAADRRVGVIQVRNEGDRPVQATVLLEDWDRAEDGTNRWYPEGTRPGSCARVLEMFPGGLNLAPGAGQSVRVAVGGSAPPSSRECWAAVVFETTQLGTANGRAVTYHVRTAVKVYVGTGDLGIAGDLADVSISRNRQPTDSVAARLAVVFQNTGARHLIARGHVEVRRLDNSVAARLPMPDLPTLPGASYRAVVPIPKLAPGRYAVLAIVDFGGDEILAQQVEYEVM